MSNHAPRALALGEKLRLLYREERGRIWLILRTKLNLPDFPAALIPPSQLSAATRPNNHFEGVSVLSRRARVVTSHVTSPYPAGMLRNFNRKLYASKGPGEVGKLCFEEHSTCQQIPLVR